MTGLKRGFWMVLLAAMMAAGGGAAAQENVVNLYSSRHYESDELMYQEFADQTGIQVNRIEANGNALIERIANEGANSPADILLTVDAGVLWRAEERGLLQPVSSPVLASRIPENLRHPEGRWFGFARRARLIYYNPELIDPSNLKNYEDLADPGYRGEVCIRSSSNIYNLSLTASMIAHHGVEETERWARGVVANFARDPQGGDTDQIRAVASGECGIGVANSYYFARIVRSDDARDQDVAAHVRHIFPNQEGRGTHVNITGAGVVATAPHRANAIRFLEYLSSDSAQKFFSEASNEYPAVPGILADPVLVELGEFKADPLNVSNYGRYQAEAQRLLDRAGWK